MVEPAAPGAVGTWHSGREAAGGAQEAQGQQLHPQNGHVSAGLVSERTVVLSNPSHGRLVKHARVSQLRALITADVPKDTGRGRGGHHPVQAGAAACHSAPGS